MAKANATTNAKADTTIDALLQQRAQYEQWLARLNTTTDTAPASVRDRVRGDYEGRLGRVIDELRGHATTIAEELDQHRAEQDRLDAECRTAEEVLAEAEVRHVVGEYAEDEWQRLSGESRRHVDGLRGELQKVDAEIARLAEVQALIESPSRAAEPEPEPMMSPVVRSTSGPAPTPVPVPVATMSAQVSMPLETVMPMPAMTQPDPEPVAAEPALADTSDELAFLRSVADEEPPPVAPSRRSSNSGAGAASKVAAEPAGTATAIPAPVPSTPAASTPAPGAGAGASKAGMAKTLKCSECGTFNRPTEWYCERCGAELAGL